MCTSHATFLLQDFVRHFHVLMPHGTTPTKSGVREFFRRSHLPPAGYQVGSTMVRDADRCSLLLHAIIAWRTSSRAPVHAQVFLREAERQRLQTLLHQEVLRRIVVLQRRFRALLERKHFVNLRQAAGIIQVRKSAGF